MHYVWKDKFLNKIYLFRKMTDSLLISSLSLLSLSVVYPDRGQQSPAFGSHCHWNHCGTLQLHAHPIVTRLGSIHTMTPLMCYFKLPASYHGVGAGFFISCFCWNSPEITLACVTFSPYWEITPQCFVISNPFFQTVAKSLNHSVSKLLYVLYVWPVWVSTSSCAWRTNPNSSYKVIVRIKLTQNLKHCLNKLISSLTDRLQREASCRAVCVLP